jgi:hypothetical protein
MSTAVASAQRRYRQDVLQLAHQLMGCAAANASRCAQPSSHTRAKRQSNAAMWLLQQCHIAHDHIQTNISEWRGLLGWDGRVRVIRPVHGKVTIRAFKAEE